MSLQVKILFKKS